MATTKKKRPEAPVGLLARLKRHHVFRVASVYALVAWVLLQVANALFPDIGLTRSDVRILIAALALLFPVVLVLGWMLVPPSVEDPEKFTHWQRIRWKLGSALTLGIVVLVALSGTYLWRLDRQRTPVNVAAPAVAVAAVPAKSIAVLPFENLSSDKDNAYFADGMQDLILTKLADIGDLKVVSRTSTERYGSHPQDLKTIGDELGVATLLEGSVQKAGKQVLVNVQLIDASTDSHLWAQSYQRTLDNVFGVEGEVAQQVADALKARLTPTETARVEKVATHNPAALDAFLKARFYLGDSNRTGDRAELARSVPLAQKAIQEDPDYVDAYILLALAYQKLDIHGQAAADAVRHALALDPDNSNAHTEYAFQLEDRGELDAAIAEARRAVALPSHRPNDFDGLGFILMDAGQFDEAVKAFQHAVDADPTINFSREWLASASAQLRHYSEARDGLLYVTARDPDDIMATSTLAEVYRYGWGDLAAARKALQATATPVRSSPLLSEAWYALDLAARDYPAAAAVIVEAPAALFDDAPRSWYEARIARDQGDTLKAQAAFAAARDQLETQLKTAPDDSALQANLAVALAGLGDGDRAVALANRAVATVPNQRRTGEGRAALKNLASVYAHTGHAGEAIEVLTRLLSMPAGLVMSVAALRIDPEWDTLRHDPRFQALLESDPPR